MWARYMLHPKRMSSCSPRRSAAASIFPLSFLRTLYSTRPCFAKPFIDLPLPHQSPTICHNERNRRRTANTGVEPARSRTTTQCPDRETSREVREGVEGEGGGRWWGRSGSVTPHAGDLPKRFRNEFSVLTIGVAELRRLAWSGIPSEVRPIAWQLLLVRTPLTAAISRR